MDVSTVKRLLCSETPVAPDSSAGAICRSIGIVRPAWIIVAPGRAMLGEDHEGDGACGHPLMRSCLLQPSSSQPSIALRALCAATLSEALAGPAGAQAAPAPNAPAPPHGRCLQMRHHAGFTSER